MTICNHKGKREGGVVAIMVTLLLTALIGFAGLALDLGRLYVNKTELQNAVDACALAAANELVCEPGLGTCPAEFLHNAEAAGIFAAGKNFQDFQQHAVVIEPADIRFHTAIEPNGSYLPRSAGADVNSRFAMCSASVAGIVPWFMGILGLGPHSVDATAVATLAPGQTACNAAPLGICAANPAATSFGFTTANWITSNYTHTGNTAELTDGLRWVDFRSGAGGADAVHDQLLGNGAACGIRIGDTVKIQTGANDARKAWNTRFGIYTGSESVATAAPDRTGYAYPSQAPGPAIPVNASAYADYRARQAANAPFTPFEYAPDSAGISAPISAATHLSHGAERRLVAVPVIDCGGAVSGKGNGKGNGAVSVPILGMACALMLNPMSNGGSGTVFLEWRGLAGDAASPCRSAGIAGGAGGALVTTLVQ